MSTELIVGWVALLIAVIGVAVSLWAIWDVRKQVKELITLDRKLLYTRLRNDLVWQFVEPIQSVHPKEIAKGLEEFAVISQALNPAHTAEVTKHAVENETLVFAKKLVDSGYAQFKPEWDEKKIREMIRSWQNSINANRVAEILGEQQDGTPFTKG
jgi:hypothetical protein